MQFGTRTFLAHQAGGSSAATRPESFILSPAVRIPKKPGGTTPAMKRAHGVTPTNVIDYYNGRATEAIRAKVELAIQSPNVKPYAAAIAIQHEVGKKNEVIINYVARLDFFEAIALIRELVSQGQGMSRELFARLDKKLANVQLPQQDKERVLEAWIKVVQGSGSVDANTLGKFLADANPPSAPNFDNDYLLALIKCDLDPADTGKAQAVIDKRPDLQARLTAVRREHGIRSNYRVRTITDRELYALAAGILDPSAEMSLRDELQARPYLQTRFDKIKEELALTAE